MMIIEYKMKISVIGCILFLILSAAIYAQAAFPDTLHGFIIFLEGYSPRDLGVVRSLVAWRVLRHEIQVRIRWKVFSYPFDYLRGSADIVRHNKMTYHQAAVHQAV